MLIRTIIADTLSAAVFNTRTLGIVVWIGLAVLSIALLVLMRTRWGQVKPLSKCIVLSVFAHFLLFMYAYGTRLFIPPPPGRGDEVIQLAFVSTDAAADAAVQTPQTKPWEQFVAEDVHGPDSLAPDWVTANEDTPQRAAGDVEWVAAREVIPDESIPNPDPSRPVVEHPPREVPVRTDSMVKAAVIDTPVTTPRAVAAPEPMMPVPIAPQPRPAAAVVPTTPTPNPHKSSEPVLPTQLTDVGSSMQQLADIAPQVDTADARAGSTDRVAQSDNRGASQTESSGIADIARRMTEQTLSALPPATGTLRAESIATMAGPELVRHLVARAAPRLADGQPTPQAYVARNTAQRSEWAVRQGGSMEAEAAVDAGLTWLAAHQESDGRWDADRWGAGFETKTAGHDRGGAGTNADTGITGLAILAFLANGQTHLEGKCRKNVQQGLEFLLRSQAIDGNLAGQSRLYASMYCHGMATLAMSEALAMTGDVRIRPYVQKAINYSVEAQNPTSGGWRYQPGDQGDMSQFGWQVMAIKSAGMAGIAVPETTRTGMISFLNRCAQGRHDGLSCYQPGRPSSRAMTAESLVCRYFLGIEPDQDLQNEATQFILGELPQSGRPNLYYWYYGTLALYQVQGPAWSRWNQAMQRQLLAIQRSDGPYAGSWDPDTVWGSYGGRVYSTALGVLCLEVYYRYLPLNLVNRFDSPQAVSTIK